MYKNIDTRAWRNSVVCAEVCSLLFQIAKAELILCNRIQDKDVISQGRFSVTGENIF